MSSEDKIREHQRKLDELRDSVRDRKDEVLKNINLDSLMKNPTEYMTKLSNEFYKSNSKQIQQGIDLGKKLATSILKDIDNGKNRTS